MSRRRILDLNIHISKCNKSIQKFNERKCCAYRPDVAERLREDAIVEREQLIKIYGDPQPDYQVRRVSILRRYNR